jgi:hypothetical protein
MELKTRLFSIFPKEKVAHVVSGFTKDEIGRVSSILGVSLEEIDKVLAQLT